MNEETDFLLLTRLRVDVRLRIESSGIWRGGEWVNKWVDEITKYYSPWMSVDVPNWNVQMLMFKMLPSNCGGQQSDSWEGPFWMEDDFFDRKFSMLSVLGFYVTTFWFRGFTTWCVCVMSVFRDMRTRRMLIYCGSLLQMCDDVDGWDAWWDVSFYHCEN